MAKFLKGEAIKYGWDATKKNLGFFVLAIIVALVISVIFGYATNLSKENAALSVIINLVSWVVNSIIGLGFIKISLKILDSKKPEMSDLFTCYPLIVKYFVSSLVFTLMVLAGALLLVIPGIIIAIRGQFYNYFIVEKNSGPIEAIKLSFAATKGSTWNLFLLALIFLGVLALGALALLIGLFAAIPTLMLASVFVYRKLSS